MSSSSLTSDQILSLLATTPQCLKALTVGVEPTRLQISPGDGEWSANAILAHLRSCADVWGNCIVEILSRDRPTIRAINPTTWIKSTNYLELDFQHSFQAYATQRSELLALLEPLTAEDWARSATVTGAGNALQRTAQLYAQWLARHERQHVKHFEQMMNTLRH